MMPWEEYIGRFVSVLIDGKDGKVENYLGTITHFDAEPPIIVLAPNNPNFNVCEILIRPDIIRSIWVYKDNIPP